MTEVIDGEQFISAEFLANVCGVDGADRRNRHYTKGIKKKFSNQIAFVKLTTNQLQTVLVPTQNSKVNIARKAYILNEAACFTREEFDIFLLEEKSNSQPPTIQFLTESPKKSSQLFKRIFSCYFTDKK